MRVIDFRCRGAVRVRPAMLIVAACAIAACTGHGPTRSVVPRQATNAPVGPERNGWKAQRSETQAKTDLAESRRYALDPSEAGYYLDVLQGRLLQLLGTDAKLSRTKDRIGIDLAHRVQFDARSPWLDETGCRILKPLARALMEFRKTVIFVTVGADGTDGEAKVLAQRRSDAVAECLVHSGITPRRIVIPAMLSDRAAVASGSALRLDVELVLRGTGKEP